MCLVQGGHGPYLVTDDPQHLLAADWDASANTFRLLSKAEASFIFKKLLIQLAYPGDGRRTPALPAHQKLAFGSAKKFELLLKNSTGTAEENPMIVEHRRDATRKFPLPQSSRKEWKLRRPDDAKSIFPASSAEIGEQIGPHQVEGDRLWFGETFYNGEGWTGVGGFGYFDAASRSYKLISPPEIWPWSVSALLVEPDAVWLGLVHYGEGGNAPGGLLRWDRARQSLRRFDIRAEIHQIMRSQEALYLATDDGIAVLRGSEVERYIMDSEPNGRFHVVACDGGYR